MLCSTESYGDMEDVKLDDTTSQKAEPLGGLIFPSMHTESNTSSLTKEVDEEGNAINERTLSQVVKRVFSDATESLREECS